MLWFPRENIFHIFFASCKHSFIYFDEDVRNVTRGHKFLYPVLHAMVDEIYDITMYTICQFILKWHIMFKMFSKYNYQFKEINVIRINRPKPLVMNRISG